MSGGEAGPGNSAPERPAGPAASGSSAGGISGTGLGEIELPPPETAAGTGVVFVVCAVVAYVGWTPLSIPPRIVSGIVLAVAPSTCTQYSVGSLGMSVCSTAVGLFTVLGPVAVIGVLYYFRKQVTAALNRAAARVPTEYRYFVAPVIATLLFTMGWAGIHHPTPNRMGILPHRLFPALVGLLTFVTVQHGSAIVARLGGINAARERFSFRLRLVITVLFPLVVSIAITRQPRVTSPALKEQFVVLLAIAVGWLLLAPLPSNDDNPPPGSESRDHTGVDT